MKTRLVLLAFASLCVLTGCRPAVIPDPLIPHRVADETTVTVWTRRPDGSFSKQKVKVADGWWLASPTLIGE